MYPKRGHTLYGVLITKTKTISNTFALISIGFCFSLSYFPSWALDHLVVITIITMIITCSITWHVPTSLSLHTLSKTKLGLWISPFLVIDDNPFTKIFNKIFLDLYFLPKQFSMCKYYGEVSSTQIGSNCSPYICAKSLDLKARTYAWIGNIGVNFYQMMLRCKKWTFKAWHQSELTIYTIRSTISN